MLFSSMIFLWVFLPIIVIAFYLIDKRYKNSLLVLASLFFYAWGEPIYILLMLFSILFNWGMGIVIEKTVKRKKVVLIFDLCVNIGMLIIFKYLNMLIIMVNTVMRHDLLPNKGLALPIGISFYTFQVMSYIIDLYRGKYKAQKNLISMALYISFFPQLIAGPIVRYEDINQQIDNRNCSLEQTATGIRRFIYGLGKKVIIANTLAEGADAIFALGISDLTGVYAWIGSILYTLQIYFDFSGYSDMAIGLGHIFGFHFLENFNYPYLSTSITEFWRRWHISLGTWFREYLYIPLGGNRKGRNRTYFNLLIVFMVTGLWHGASWNFVLWGLYYGVLIIIERIGFLNILKKLKLFSWIYSMMFVNFGWVLFKQTEIIKALTYIKRMLLPWKYTISTYTLAELVNCRILLIVVMAILGSGVVKIIERKVKWTIKWKNSILELVYCMMIVIGSMMLLAGNSYNPFIYFRF